MRQAAHVIAFGFGAGRAPFAPGTFGTLLAWPAGWALGAAHPGVNLAVVAVLFVLGVWACGVTGRDLGVHDDGCDHDDHGHDRCADDHDEGR